MYAVFWWVESIIYAHIGDVVEMYVVLYPVFSWIKIQGERPI